MLGGVAAALTALVLLIGAVASAFQPQGLGLRNWLVVLFQTNSGFGSLPSDPLTVGNPLDIAVLALVSLTFFGLWRVLGRAHRIWYGIAVVQPLAGIPLLLITGQHGRSAVMGGGLVISVLILAEGKSRLLGVLGLAANALLLAGDLSTGVLTGGFVATAIAIGYALVVCWFALLALSLVAPVEPSRVRARRTPIAN